MRKKHNNIFAFLSTFLFCAFYDILLSIPSERDRIEMQKAFFELPDINNAWHYRRTAKGLGVRNGPFYSFGKMPADAFVRTQAAEKLKFSTLSLPNSGM